MTNNDNRVPYHSNMLFTDYDSVVCPICGQRIKHPYTGLVTSEQIDEDANTCQWMEVCDEGDGTLGWTPICRNIHPYTLKSEDNNYIHYDLIELANMWDMPLADKIEKATNFILSVFKDKGINKEDIVVTVVDNKLDNIKICDSIKELQINIDVDKDGNISFKAN